MACFQIWGYIPVETIFVKISFKGSIMDSSHIDNILADTSSGPLLLFLLIPRIRERISSLVIGIDLNRCSVR